MEGIIDQNLIILKEVGTFADKTDNVMYIWRPNEGIRF
jgi:hypothetical protein